MFLYLQLCVQSDSSRLKTLNSEVRDVEESDGNNLTRATKKSEKYWNNSPTQIPISRKNLKNDEITF